MKIFFHQLEYIITNVSAGIQQYCLITHASQWPLAEENPLTYSSNKSSDEEESLTECPARVKRHVVSG